MLQDELRQEKQNRERLSREKELLTADKYTLEQNLNVRVLPTVNIISSLRSYE